MNQHNSDHCVTRCPWCGVKLVSFAIEEHQCFLLSDEATTNLFQKVAEARRKHESCEPPALAWMWQGGASIICPTCAVVELACSAECRHGCGGRGCPDVISIRPRLKPSLAIPTNVLLHIPNRKEINKP